MNKESEEFRIADQLVRTMDETKFLSLMREANRRAQMPTNPATIKEKIND